MKPEYNKIKNELCNFKNEIDDFYYDAISRKNPIDVIKRAKKAAVTYGQSGDFGRERNFIEKKMLEKEKLYKKMEYLYVKITLMFGEQKQNSYCEPIDKPISFYELNECGETTKESKEWFKIEFIKMTEDEYKKIPEFDGF